MTGLLPLQVAVATLSAPDLNFFRTSYNNNNNSNTNSRSRSAAADDEYADEDDSNDYLFSLSPQSTTGRVVGDNSKNDTFLPNEDDDVLFDLLTTTPPALFDYSTRDVFITQLHNSTTMNTTSSSSNESTTAHLLLIIALTLLLGFIVIWTIVGNLIVFVCYVSEKRLRTLSNILILNLACGDIGLAVLVLPFQASYLVQGKWIFGELWCELWLSIDVLFCTCSIWAIVAIGYDRYQAIHALSSINSGSGAGGGDSGGGGGAGARRNLRSTVTLCVAVWLLSALISIPPLIGWKTTDLYTYDPHTNAAQCMLFNTHGYVIYSASGSFIVPSVFIVIVYGKIFHAYLVWIRRRKTQLNTSTSTTLTATTTTTTSRAAATTTTKTSVATRSTVAPTLARHRNSTHSSATTPSAVATPIHNHKSSLGVLRGTPLSPLQQQQHDLPSSSMTNSSVSGGGSATAVGLELERRQSSTNDALLQNNHNHVNGIQQKTTSFRHQLFLPTTTTKPATVTSYRASNNSDSDPPASSSSIELYQKNITDVNCGGDSTDPYLLNTSSKNKNYLWCPQYCSNSRSSSHTTNTTTKQQQEFLEQFQNQTLGSLSKLSASASPAPHKKFQQNGTCGKTAPKAISEIAGGVDDISPISPPSVPISFYPFSLKLASRRKSSIESNTSGGVQSSYYYTDGKTPSDEIDTFLKLVQPTTTTAKRKITQQQQKTEGGNFVSKFVSLLGRPFHRRRYSVNAPAAVAAEQSTSADNNNEDSVITQHPQPPVCSSVYGAISTVSGGGGAAAAHTDNKRLSVTAEQQHRKDSTTQQQQQIARVTSGGGGGGTTAVVAEVLQNSKRLARRQAREARGLKIVFGILITYFVCWTGFFIVYILQGFCSAEACQLPTAVVQTFIWLGYLQSSINPIMYFYTNRDFRTAFLNMFGCRKRPRSTTPALSVKNKNIHKRRN